MVSVILNISKFGSVVLCVVYVRSGSRYFQSFRVLVCVLVLVLYSVWFEICVVLYLWCWCVCWCVGLSTCVVWFEIFSKFESVGVCALGGRIDLSPGSSREIGASGEGGLRHDDADALKPDGDDADAHCSMMLMLSNPMMLMFSNLIIMKLVLSNDAVGLKPDDEHD